MFLLVFPLVYLLILLLLSHVLLTNSVWLQELDYTMEARNIEDFYANFLDDPTVKIPKAYRALSGKEVLVMEWIDGIRCTDPQARPSTLFFLFYVCILFYLCYLFCSLLYLRFLDQVGHLFCSLLYLRSLGRSGPEERMPACFLKQHEVWDASFGVAPCSCRPALLLF